MPSKRPSALFFTGEYDVTGQPLEYFATVPARDLDEQDIANLTDEQLAMIQTERGEGRPALYASSEPKNRPARPAPEPERPLHADDRGPVEPVGEEDAQPGRSEGKGGPPGGGRAPKGNDDK